MVRKKERIKEEEHPNKVETSHEGPIWMRKLVEVRKSENASFNRRL